jgi:putative phage-type endonuclease
MTAQIIPITAGLTQEQQDIRRTGIGASEIAAVAGCSRWRTPISVYEAKVGAAPERDSAPMRWGNRLEAVIADAYAEERGVTLASPGTLRHPEHEYVLATPDRIALDADGRWARVVEIKTAGFRSSEDWGPEGTSDVPEDYLCQVQWQMLVTGLPVADLVVLIAGQDYRVYTIQRDDELIALLLQAAQQFWERHVVPGIPPPADGSPSYSEHLSRRFATDDGTMLPATDEARDLVRRYVDAKDEADAAEERAELLRQQVQALVGEASGIEGLCAWRSVKPRAVTDWQQIAAALGATPEVIAQHTRPGKSYRRFTLKKGASHE